MKHRTIVVLLTLLLTASAYGQINTSRMMDVGRTALYYNDYALSIRYFTQIIDAKPHLYEAYFWRALAKFYLEDYMGAERDCALCIDINPYYPNSYELRGLARINLGKYEGASADYTEATNMSPENRSLWHNWVLCNLEMDSLTTADSVCVAIIRKWPKSGDGWMLRSQTQLQMGDTLLAEQLADSALSVDRYSVSALSLKASFLLHKEEYASADSVLSEALRLQPRHTHNLINRALARYYQNNLRGAMADYDLALDIDPANFVGHYNRGLLRATVGEDNLALEDFDFILRIDSTDVMVIYNRAEMRLSTGDYQGAADDYTTLIETYPNFLQGYARRAEARRAMGDERGAQRDENHVLQEELAHRYGMKTKATSQGPTTRKKSEVDLDEYQKLVVDDGEEETQYESEYRGKIQNKAADLSLQAPLSLTDYQRQAAGDTEDYDLALEHLLLEEYMAAIDKFSLTIDHHPSLAEAYYNRAYAYAQLKHYAHAKADLDTAISLKSDFAQAYYNRAVINILSSNNEEAIPDLSRAGELGIYSAYSLIKHHAPKHR